MPRRPSPDPTIGERIRVRRLLHGWSVRYAASRGGISHATWSRIERGLQAADNRFVLADIATALECSPADLTGTPVPAAGRDLTAVDARVAAIRRALVDIDLSTPRHAATRPIAQLRHEAGLACHLWRRCDYAGAGRLLPGLLHDLNAAVGGPHHRPAMRLLSVATSVATAVLRCLPADFWLGAERCRTVAEATGDPVLLGYAAYRQAMAAAFCGSDQRCLSLTEQTADDLRNHLARPGAMEVLGMLSLAGAAAAHRLARPADSATKMAEAADIARRTGETTTFGMFFGPVNVSFWHIGIQADGGDADRAVAIAQAVDPARIDAPVRQVFFYTDLARACARLPGKHRQAIRYLLTAERIAPQHVAAFHLVRDITRVLLGRSQQPADSTALRGLCERLGLA